MSCPLTVDVVADLAFIRTRRINSRNSMGLFEGVGEKKKRKISQFTQRPFQMSSTESNPSRPKRRGRKKKKKEKKTDRDREKKSTVKVGLQSAAKMGHPSAFCGLETP